jgi:exonuclease III
MKIVSWNCQMAFRKKAHLIQTMKPDILVIPECEHPDKLVGLGLHPTSSLWYGNNKNKGLGIFSFGNYEMNMLDIHDKEIEIVCPVMVTSGFAQFALLAVWAQQSKDWDYRYIGQVWKAIHYYKKLLTENHSIIIGDFNSNVIWDKDHRLANHSMTVNKLKDLKLSSAYHDYFSCEHGSEQHSTFYLYKHEYRRYHIDYCFLSEYFGKRLLSVEVGEYSTWKQYSDHSPLIVEINI